MIYPDPEVMVPISFDVSSNQTIIATIQKKYQVNFKVKTDYKIQFIIKWTNNKYG